MFRNALASWRTSFRGISRAVWLLALVSLVNRCGGMVLAFLGLYLKEELHFGLGDIGIITACFGVGAIGGAFAGGWLTDKFGPIAVQVSSLILNGVLLIAMLLVRGYWPMIIALTLLGFITEVFRPANSVAVLRASKPADRTRSYSLVRLAFNIGWTVAPAIGGLVAYYLGWSWLFWADGLTCMAAAALLWWRVPPALQAAKPVPTEANLAAASSSPFRDGAFTLFFLCSFFAAMVFLPIVWSVPLYYKDVFGWTEAQIGMMAALNGAIVAVVEMPLVFGLEAKWSPLRMVRVGLLLYGISYLCLWAIGAPFALLAGLGYTIAISLGEIFVMPFSTTWVSLRTSSASQGRYLAMYSLSYAIANVVAPILGLQVAAHAGYGALWLICVAMCVAAFVGIALLSRREKHQVSIS